MTGRGVASLLVVALVALSACSGSDDDSASTTTASSATTVTSDDPAATAPPAAETTTEVETTMSDTTTVAPDDGATTSTGSLVGQWRADSGDVLEILTAPYGATRPACSGPYVLSFGADEWFRANIDLVCTVGALEAVGELSSTGRYTDDGSTFQVVDGVGEGSMTIGGVDTPLPIADALIDPFSVPADYTITGDVLSFSFTSPDGNDFTLEFTRVA
jgi:hypothetical protein